LEEIAKIILLKHLKKERGEKIQKLIEISDHTSEINAILECMNLVIKECADERNHPDAFYESGTWWIPKDSILNNFNINNDGKQLER
jgi:hypothetical protein